MLSTKRQRSASPGSSKKKVTSFNNSLATKKSHSEWKKWKRQQSHDYNTHQFLDASATVHAGLFGARRLPEIKSLWRQTMQGELNNNTLHNSDANERPTGPIRRAGDSDSGGGKISSRHLRRRTNSHKPRRHRRFFSQGNKGAESGNVGDNIKEEEDAISDADAKLEHDVKKKSSIHAKDKKRSKPPCRRARRKPRMMKIAHSNWWQKQTNNNVQLVETLQSSIQPKVPHHWIPTHMWHAKRFHVSPQLFSWSIPLIHSNRGSRASLRLASSETHPKCTIQDATWEINGCAIKLEVSKGDTKKQSEILISILQRLCGTDASFLSTTGQLRAGDGMIHEIDSFPLQPIGPATFLFGNSNDGDGSSNQSVSILVHPAIHRRVSLLFHKVLALCNDDDDVSISTVPMSLLRIRGRATISTLKSVLTNATHISSLDIDANHGTLIDLGTITCNESSTTNINQSSILLKCHQPNQNYQHLPNNLASSGYDILCHPSLCAKLFQSLTVAGACAIGFTEDTRAQLEAYPPLPLFPRDYPDTDEGKAYWEVDTRDVVSVNSQDSQNKKQLNTSWKDWAVLRTCIEGSWGRINTPLKRTLRNRKQYDDEEKRKRQKESKSFASDSQGPQLVRKHQVFGREVSSIHWESIIASVEESSSVVVVRGSFGIPFLQLLNGCGRLHTPDTTKESRRRPRRKVRPPNVGVHASPLSKIESEAHSNLCQELKASLSLPALLRCELYCEGKGTLTVGDLILPLHSNDDDEDNICAQGSNLNEEEEGSAASVHADPLGVVVAGGFSPSLGKCHGIGIIGASKFIDALDGTFHGMGMTMPQFNGQRKMALKVMITRDASPVGRYALLSILF